MKSRWTEPPEGHLCKTITATAHSVPQAVRLAATLPLAGRLSGHGCCGTVLGPPARSAWSPLASIYGSRWR